MSERLIVIGGGGAGTIAKRLNPDMKVTLFTEFPEIAYSLAVASVSPIEKPPIT